MRAARLTKGLTVAPNLLLSMVSLLLGMLSHLLGWFTAFWLIVMVCDWWLQVFDALFSLLGTEGDWKFFNEAASSWLYI
jgi:hypothetical protein